MQELDEHGFGAKIILDSVFQESRLTTMQLRYPRFIHAEFMTHRMFSRNASSSRAIPVKKMIDQVRHEPAEPVHWGKNQPGMQAREEVTGSARANAIHLWRRAAREAADNAEKMEMIGLHKQVANRILEPFQFMSVIVSSTEWSNFYTLRDHHDAEPNIQHLAQLMINAQAKSAPKELGWNEFHIPYITAEEQDMPTADLIRLSVARCARVSYLNHDQTKPDMATDFGLADKIRNSDPCHASPMEHQARTCPGWSTNLMRGNFSNKWYQYRKFVEENEDQAFYGAM